jgi:hypothetical protein
MRQGVNIRGGGLREEDFVFWGEEDFFNVGNFFGILFF